MYYMDFW